MRERLRMRNLIIVIGLCFFMTGCASVHSMPQSANEVNFTPDVEGRTGWSKYEEVFFLNGVDKRTAYFAAKEGLSESGVVLIGLISGFTADYVISKTKKD